MAIASPAFAINEPLPEAYTCDGEGISPPLRWRNVPPDAAALVLYVIDTSQGYGRHGGLRWVVADIDPQSHGVAAGQIPRGGIVGSNSEGKASYGPICPGGQGGWVEFQLFALSEQIPVSPGYQPSALQAKDAGHILASAATYNLYIRP